MYKDIRLWGTLGKAILWTCFDAEAQDTILLQIIKRMVTASQRIQNHLSPTENTIWKFPLAIYGHNGQLIIDELFEGKTDVEDPSHDENISPTSPEQPNRRRSSRSYDIQAVFPQLISTKR